jgi:hypothetical protein
MSYPDLKKTPIYGTYKRDFVENRDKKKYQGISDWMNKSSEGKRNSTIDRTKNRKKCASSTHPIFLCSVECISRDGKFIRDNIAQIHEIVQALFQGFDSSCAVYSMSEKKKGRLG